jgi:methyl-accepting chemotaxis protein
MSKETPTPTPQNKTQKAGFLARLKKSLRLQLYVALGLTGVVLAFLSEQAIVAAFKDRAVATRLEYAGHVNHYLHIFLDDLTSERGTGVILLLGKGTPAAEAVRSENAKDRKEGEEAFRDAQKYFTKLLPILKKTNPDIEQIYQDFLTLHNKVVAARPQVDAGTISDSEWAKICTDAFEKGVELEDQCFFPVDARGRIVHANTILGNAILNATEFATLQRGIISRNILKQTPLSEQDYLDINLYQTRFNAQLASLEQHAHHKSTPDEVRQAINAVKAAAEGEVSQVRQSVLAAGRAQTAAAAPNAQAKVNYPLTADKWHEVASKPVAALVNLTATTAKFNSVDEATIHRQAIFDIVKIAVLGVLTIAAIVGLTLWFQKRIITRVAEVSVAADKIGTGDWTVRSQTTGVDELGVMAKSINGMVDGLVTAEKKAKDENTMLQTGINDLLNKVSDASDGDFTVRINVTEGRLGNVGDAMNLMIENISELLGKVREVATQVGASATQIQASSQQMAAGAEKQSGEIVNTTSAVQEMSVNIEAVSNNANTAAEAAKRAKDAAEQGNKAVNEVVAGMEKLREDVQSLAKKIKRLGERSMEISTIVNTINDISGQTNILALNAAIEAARAGDQGRGFAVVAEEVRKLAERTANSTREIEKLITGIQAETNEAVSSMEQQTALVEEESKTVSAAGEALNRISQASVQSAELINEINLSGKQQVRGAAGVTKAMEVVAQVADQARIGAVQTKQSTEALANLSAELNKRLSKFKIAA